LFGCHKLRLRAGRREHGPIPKGLFRQRSWLTSSVDWRWIHTGVRWWVWPRGRSGRGGVCDENAELERRFGFDCNLNKTSYG
jgi:hypothetical protein